MTVLQAMYPRTQHSPNALYPPRTPSIATSVSHTEHAGQAPLDNLHMQIPESKLHCLALTQLLTTLKASKRLARTTSRTTTHPHPNQQTTPILPTIPPGHSPATANLLTHPPSTYSHAHALLRSLQGRRCQLYPKDYTWEGAHRLHHRNPPRLKHPRLPHLLRPLRLRDLNLRHPASPVL